jgi:hypothetical protein
MIRLLGKISDNNSMSSLRRSSRMAKLTEEGQKYREEIEKKKKAEEARIEKASMGMSNVRSAKASRKVSRRTTGTTLRQRKRDAKVRASVLRYRKERNTRRMKMMSKLYRNKPTLRNRSISIRKAKREQQVTRHRRMPSRSVKVLSAIPEENESLNRLASQLRKVRLADSKSRSKSRNILSGRRRRMGL